MLGGALLSLDTREALAVRPVCTRSLLAGGTARTIGGELLR